MNPLLPILIPLASLSLIAFAIAIFKAAARADAIDSRQLLEGQASVYRLRRAPVFLVDEHGETETRIELRA